MLFLHNSCTSRRPSGFHGDAPDKEVKAEEGNDESKPEGVKKVSNLVRLLSSSSLEYPQMA